MKETGKPKHNMRQIIVHSIAYSYAPVIRDEKESLVIRHGTRDFWRIEFHESPNGRVIVPALSSFTAALFPYRTLFLRSITAFVDGRDPQDDRNSRERE